MDVATLAELLHETAEHHDAFEKRAPKHDWWDWYAPYLDARENGSTPEEAAVWPTVTWRRFAMSSRADVMSFIRNVVAGAIAGAAGTAAMDYLLYRRYRVDDGKETFWRWEFAGDVMGWDDASAPGQLGQKVERIALQRQPPETWARTTTNVVHWATGIGWGIQYGVLADATSRHPLLRALALGPSAWLSGYVILPLAKVYKPIWTYDARTLGDDLSAHLVFGSATAAAFAALTREKR